MPLVTDDGWPPPVSSRRPSVPVWSTYNSLSWSAAEALSWRLGTRTTATSTTGYGGTSGFCLPTVILLVVLLILTHCRFACALSSSVTTAVNTGVESFSNRTLPVWVQPDPQQCLILETGLAEQVCKQPVWKRRETMRPLRLRHCSGYNVAHVYNSETCRLEGSQNDCRNCLDEIECLDNSVYAMLKQFEDLLAAVDCGSNYSTHWGCRDCQVNILLDCVLDILQDSISLVCRMRK